MSDLMSDSDVSVSKCLTWFFESQFCSVEFDDDQKITDQAVMCNQLASSGFFTLCSSSMRINFMVKHPQSRRCFVKFKKELEITSSKYYT